MHEEESVQILNHSGLMINPFQEEGNDAIQSTSLKKAINYHDDSMTRVQERSFKSIYVYTIVLYRRQWCHTSKKR